jgi:hypothetical protein
VPDQLYRYEELVALHLADSGRLKARLADQKQVILALDGLQPDVGHEVLWVLMDYSSRSVFRRFPTRLPASSKKGASHRTQLSPSGSTSRIGSD